MLYVYSSKTALKIHTERDLIGELRDKAGDEDIEGALRTCGYLKEITIGDEDYAEIELFLARPGEEFGAVALVNFGGRIETYAMATFHDALDFLKEYTPTIKTIVELADRKALEQLNYK